MMRMHRLNAVGLPISADDAFRRVADAIVVAPRELGSLRPVYISYSTPDGKFATDLARGLADRRIPAWVATLDIRVGENWRDAQARAMLQSSAHLVVLDEAMVNQAVLRTEILLAEASGLRVLTVLPQRLQGKSKKIADLMRSLNSSDQTYRRLADTQAFSATEGLPNSRRTWQTRWLVVVIVKAVTNQTELDTGSIPEVVPSATAIFEINRSSFDCDTRFG